MELTNAIETLSALAHESRLTLVRLLIQAGPEGLGAGELAANAGLAATTASAQLLVLKNAGLVKSERRGRHINYAADYQQMSSLLGFLMEDCCCSRTEICHPLKTVIQ